MGKVYNFDVVILKEPVDPGYYALCPALPGCFSNGLTPEDTQRNMQEAIALYLEGLQKDGEEIAELTEPMRVVNLQVAV